MEEIRFDIGDAAELATPVGLYGSSKQPEIFAGEDIFAVVIAAVLNMEPPIGA